MSPQGLLGSSRRPEAKPWAFVAVGLCIAAHVLARYLGRWGYDDSWQTLHVALGLLYVTSVLRVAHGRHFWQWFDRRSLTLLLGTTVAALVFWHWGRADTYHQLVARHVPPQGSWGPVFPFIYLVVGATLVRGVGPAIALWLGGVRSKEVGLRRDPMRPPSKVWKVYLALFVAVLPVIGWAATTPAFQARYPLARAMITLDGAIPWEQFLGYQALYLLMFVSGEFLYRGVMTFGLHRRLGLYGIAYMLVPYTFSHFGKPLAETLGAILAGALLAFLALKHRSIWLGVALHYAVALTMDLLAMLHNGIRIQ